MSVCVFTRRKWGGQVTITHGPVQSSLGDLSLPYSDPLPFPYHIETRPPSSIGEQAIDLFKNVFVFNGESQEKYFKRI